MAGEGLHHVGELPPVAEEVDEIWGLEAEGEEESKEDEVNGPECLWPHGEREPEEDPEDWIDRVADEGEEKRLQELQALERPEGSTAGSVTWPHAMCMTGERNLITIKMGQQARGGIEDQG